MVAFAGGDPEVGERLAGLAGCAACHTADDGEPYAGGYAIVTDYGTFYGSNLTPHPEHGLGQWTFDDFHRAMRRGKAPDGRPYAPAFPYDQFTGLTDADLEHLWAWLQSRPAVERPDRLHDVKRRARSRFWLGWWRRLYFDRGPFEADAALTEVEARGAYLGEAVGHCGGCHTPRNRNGARRTGRALEGSDAEPEPAPALVGLGWGLDDWQWFLQTGTTDEGDVVGGEMWRIVEHGTATLPEADQEALAAWLLVVTRD
ncbi:MAG: cytochrome c [Myxococcota bacterium]